MKELSGWVVIMFWLAGTVLAKGFWNTTAAIFFPPYAWYLIVEKCMVMIGWVSA